MYSLIAIFLIIVGGILLIPAKKTAKDKKVISLIIGILGTALIVIGVCGLYLLLSGKISLPLTKS